jgi:ubiquinone/menaquinone biosynthesis C-methylase UbiE
MSRLPNAQYNLAKAGSLSIHVATRVRDRMFASLMKEFSFSESDEILDLGVTSDQTYSSSNYFERLYPFKHRITAAGIDDAKFLEDQYPGVRFSYANALSLPFPDRSFDYVHSSAVLEHVGSFENQAKMLAECLRVARKGVCLTTPNRWFPIEFHTLLPIIHWLPKATFRRVLVFLNQDELAQEENLNLMTQNELCQLTDAHRDWDFRFASASLFYWKSNLILFGRRPGARRSN